MSIGTRLESWFDHQRCTPIVPIILAACCWSNIGAQAPFSPPSYWANAYGGSEFEDAFSVVQAADGGFVIGGTTNSFGAGSQDLWIIKLTTDGTIEWQRSYGGANDEMLVAMRRAADEGYIVAGYTNTAEFSAGTSDFWIVKLSEAGEIEWEYAYGDADINGPAFTIQATDDGGYITAGMTQHFADRDVLVIKLDEAGEIQWQREYGGDGIERRPENILETPDGGYIFAASSTSFSPGSAVWVVKIDSDGDIEWQKQYGEGDVEDIQLAHEGGYIVLSEKNIRPLDSDYWVIKLSSAGDIEWQKAYGGVGQDDTQPLLPTDDGGYLISGSTESFGGTTENVWLVKLDAGGNIEWEKIYGGGGEDEIISLASARQGGYVAVGGSDSFSSGGKDFLVLRFNEQGGIGCCLPSFRRLNSEAIVTDTEEVPMDTDGMVAPAEVVRTITSATVTETSASPKKQCFFKVIPPGAVAECLSARVHYRVHSEWVMITLLLIGAGLVWMGVRFMRQRRTKGG